MLSKLSKLSLRKEDNRDNYDNTNRGFPLDTSSSGAIVQLHATAEETLRHLGELRTQVCYC